MTIAFIPRKFINKIWGPYLDLKESNEQDPKTKLQEISQQKFKKFSRSQKMSNRSAKHFSKSGESQNDIFNVLVCTWSRESFFEF